MKVFLNRRPVIGPWGGGAHFINAFSDLAPTMGVEITHSPFAADVLLIVGLDRGDTGISIDDALKLRSKRIVIRVNENDARKGTTGVDAAMAHAIQHSDGSVFVSNWIRDYFRGRLNDTRIIESSVVVTNGVDRSVFHPRPQNMLYDCSRMRIVAHHWSDNRHKGADFYEFLDDFCDKNPSYMFHYTGRHKCSFKGSNTLVTPACSGHDLGNALSFPRQSHNIYVSASRFDPGPNHILESLASGLETWVHSDGGGSVEFAGSDHTFKTEEDLVKILHRSWSLKRPNAFVPQTWSECVQSYVDYMGTLT